MPLSTIKKLLFSFILTIMSIVKVFSQFDAQISQYMFNTASFNPAAVGEGDMIEITGEHRIQWLGMPNAGQTTMFNINSPLKFGQNKSGIGINFLNDKVGQFTNQAAHLQYAYKKMVGNGTISAGVELGFVSIGFNGDSVHTIPIGDYHQIGSDPVIPKNSVSGISFDMNLGLFYSTPTIYGGISYSHINGPKIQWNDYSSFHENGTLYLTGGYKLVLADPRFVFTPSTLIKTDFRSLQIDLSSIMEYDNKYWGGIAYRLQDAIILYAGINIAGGLSIGYSYDFPASKIITVSSGSHEILVSYSFEYIFSQKNNRVKSIRLL